MFPTRVRYRRFNADRLCCGLVFPVKRRVRLRPCSITVVKPGLFLLRFAFQRLFPHAAFETPSLRATGAPQQHCRRHKITVLRDSLAVTQAGAESLVMQHEVFTKHFAAGRNTVGFLLASTSRTPLLCTCSVTQAELLGERDGDV